MELNGKTQLYFHHKNPDRTRQCWPVHSDVEVQGADATRIFQRAEYLCVYVSVTNRDTRETVKTYMSVHPKNGADFKVDTMGISWEAQYPKLAEAIEKHAGKKGLTVIV